MGIKGLFPYIRDNAPGAIVETSLKDYMGRRLAVDASMHLYSFLAAIRTGGDATHLTNSRGEATSHLQGFANRTLRMLEAGAKPVFVFDGAAPELKGKTLKGRSEAKRAAEEKLARARDADSGATTEDVYKAASASTRVTRQHNDDVKRLLRLMGVPVVEAPGEAEASCVALVRHGACDFVVTEDMDALTFGAAKMVKNLFDVEGARAKEKRPAYEIDLAAALRELGPRGLGTMAAFVDFCILCGCDYLDHVPGVGPATAAKLLKSHASLERAVVVADEAAPAAPVAPLATSSTADDGADGDEAAPAPKAAKRVGRKVGGRPVAPHGWDFRAARALFFAPTVVAAGETVDAPPPDYAALRAFLVDGHEFNGDRVDKMVARLRKCREAKPQKRIDDFFSKSPAKGPARSPPAKREPDGAAAREPDGAAKREPDGGDDIGLDAYVDARQERRGAPPAAAPAPAPPAAKPEPGARSVEPEPAAARPRAPPPSSPASPRVAPMSPACQAFFSGELRDISASASKKRKSPAKRPKPAASAEVARAFFAGETRDATPSKKKKKAG